MSSFSDDDAVDGVAFPALVGEAGSPSDRSGTSATLSVGLLASLDFRPQSGVTKRDERRPRERTSEMAIRQGGALCLL